MATPSSSLGYPSNLAHIWAIALFLGLSLQVQDWQQPDTSAWQRSFRVLERENGKPTLWESKAESSHPLQIRLVWQDDSIGELRFQQDHPFGDNEFMDLAAEFGGGGTWHELPDPAPQSEEAKTYPGIVQQWQLEGFGGALGWAGAGARSGRFFLIFRQKALSLPAPPSGPLDVMTRPKACLDTLSGWIRETCPIGWEMLPSGSQCFSPSNNPRRHIALPTRSSSQDSQHGTKRETRWMVWWNEGEGLKDIADAMKQLPKGSENGYAQDLSRILGEEGLTFLSQLAAANPCLLNQPSWTIARLKDGYIDPREYQVYLGRSGKEWHWLPALSLQTPHARLNVDIALGGAYRLEALSE